MRALALGPIEVVLAEANFRYVAVTSSNGPATAAACAIKTGMTMFVLPQSKDSGERGASCTPGPR